MPGDDHALHLGRAFINLGNLGVAHHALDGIFTRVAIATMELDGLGGHLHSGLSGKEFGHCSVGGVGETFVLLPSGATHQQARSLNLGFEVGHLELRVLELGNRLAKLLALLGVLNGLVHGALGDTQCL